MQNHIRELEQLSNIQRGDYIKSTLEEIGVEYKLQEFSFRLLKMFKQDRENIIVELGPNTSKRILITAHYNKFFRSPGANDNASGVAVLLEVIRSVKKRSLEKGLRFIFFAQEDGEAVLKGSSAYVDEYGIKDIEAVYNFDSVGIGETLIIWSPNIENRKDEIKSILDLANEQNTHHLFWNINRFRPIKFINRGGVSDHVPFIDAGFNNAFTFAFLPKEDIWFFDLVRSSKTKEIAKITIKYFFNRKSKFPKWLKHYHNNQDTSQFIETQSLEKAKQLVEAVIK